MTAAVRTLLRREEMDGDRAADRLNTLLMGIYLRLEAIEKLMAASNGRVGYTGKPGKSGSTGPNGNPTWVTVNLTTGAEVEDSFPINVGLPLFVREVTGCTVIRARNLTAPLNLFYDPPAVDWASADGSRGYGGVGLRVEYISGLDVSTEYEITLEVTHA